MSHHHTPSHKRKPPPHTPHAPGYHTTPHHTTPRTDRTANTQTTTALNYRKRSAADWRRDQERPNTGSFSVIKTIDERQAPRNKAADPTGREPGLAPSQASCYRLASPPPTASSVLPNQTCSDHTFHQSMHLGELARNWARVVPSKPEATTKQSHKLLPPPARLHYAPPTARPV